MTTSAPWRRALLAGLVGTTAMTLSTAAEKRWRGRVGQPVNPDASDHVAEAVATVVRREPRDDRETRAYYLLAHWGYGSAVALGFVPLRRVAPPGPATVAFLVGCQAMAMTLFPTLGGTAWPRRWPRDQVASSLAHHTVYAVVVALVDRATARR